MNNYNQYDDKYIINKLTNENNQLKFENCELNKTINFKNNEISKYQILISEIQNSELLNKLDKDNFNYQKELMDINAKLKKCYFDLYGVDSKNINHNIPKPNNIFINSYNNSCNKESIKLTELNNELIDFQKEKNKFFIETNNLVKEKNDLKINLSSLESKNLELKNTVESQNLKLKNLIDENNKYDKAKFYIENYKKEIDSLKNIQSTNSRLISEQSKKIDLITENELILQEKLANEISNKKLLESEVINLKNSLDNSNNKINKLSFINEELVLKINKLKEDINNLNNKNLKTEKNNNFIEQKNIFSKECIEGQKKSIENQKENYKIKSIENKKLSLYNQNLKNEKLQLQEKNWKINWDFENNKRIYLNKITKLEVKNDLKIQENIDLQDELDKFKKDFYQFEALNNKIDTYILEISNIKQEKEELIIKFNDISQENLKLVENLEKREYDYDTLFNKYVQNDYINKDYQRIISLNGSILEENNLLKKEKTHLLSKINQVKSIKRELKTKNLELVDKHEFLNKELLFIKQDYSNLQEKYSKLYSLNEKFTIDFEIIKVKSKEYKVLCDYKEEEILRKTNDILKLKKQIIIISLLLKKNSEEKNKNDYLIL